MRRVEGIARITQQKFLSIQAQDFIEDPFANAILFWTGEFLSIQAQDFIEDARVFDQHHHAGAFLSIQAQDFIEER